MQRRKFITLLGGAASAPLAAKAQPTIPVVGFLFLGLPSSNEEAIFRRGLSEQGFVEGRNVAIVSRYARNDPGKLPELAAELVARKVAVIAAPANPAPSLAAQAATRTIPIVFMYGGDPVEDGLVASFNRPGGNITGISSMNVELESKRLGLLCELVPSAKRIGFLAVHTTPESRTRSAQSAAAALGRQFEVLLARNSSDIDDAFASLPQKQIDAVEVVSNPLTSSLRSHLAAAAARAGIPAMYGGREFVEAGGLMSYATDIPDLFRQVGVYAGRILKGEKPADLPVIRPTRFEFVINLRTARLLRIDIPPTLLAIADAVID